MAHSVTTRASSRCFRDWQEDYEGLEYKHGYIQWLFPLPVVGFAAPSRGKEQSILLALLPCLTRPLLHVLQHAQAGMNFEAQPLQQHEAEAIASDPEAKARLLRSYRLMLNFYGMVLDNESVCQWSVGCRSLPPLAPALA